MRKTSSSSRNDYFVRYYNKHNCDCRKIYENLSENDAYKLEHETIVKYRKLNYCCCNFDDGGRAGGSCVGALNGMYGKTHTDEVKEKLRIINSDGRHSGENNTQYGISPKERMDEDTYKHWYEVQKARKFGETNPNYGNDTLHKRYMEDKELAKEKQSRPAEQNGRATKITMYDKEHKKIKVFSYIGACAKYLIDMKITKSKNINAVYSRIWKANKENKLYSGYYFSY